MPWTHTIVAKKIDPAFAAIPIITVEYTDGVKVERQDYRGQDAAQTAETIRRQIAQYEKSDATLANPAVTVGQPVDLTLPVPVVVPPTADEQLAAAFVAQLATLRQLNGAVRDGVILADDADVVAARDAVLLEFDKDRAKWLAFFG